MAYLHKSRSTLHLMDKDAKHLFSYSAMATIIFPLIVESALNIMIGMIDTMMVAGWSESAVSGVSSVDLLSILFINLFSAFATGGSVIVSQYLGREDDQNSTRAAKNLIYITVGTSLVIVAFLFITRAAIISALLGKADEEVQKDALLYLFPIMLSFPSLALFNACSAITRSTGRTKRNMAVSLVMNLMNLCGNYTLIYVFGLGALGAGISTLISRSVGALILFALLFRRSEEICIRGFFRISVDLNLSAKMMKLGIPQALDSGLFTLGKLLIQSYIAAIGTSALAVQAIVSNFNGYANITGMSCALATVTLVGRSAGAGRLDEERYYTRCMIVASIVLTAVTCLPLFIFTPQFVSLYGLSAESAAMAVPLCRLILFMCSTLWAFSFITPYALRATGDATFTMTVSIISMWLFRVILAGFLIKNMGFGVEAAWYGMYTDWAVRSVIYGIRYKGKRWQMRKVI